MYENFGSLLFLDSIEFLHIPVATIVWREIIELQPIRDALFLHDIQLEYVNVE